MTSGPKECLLLWWGTKDGFYCHAQLHGMVSHTRIGLIHEQRCNIALERSGFFMEQGYMNGKQIPQLKKPMDSREENYSSLERDTGFTAQGERPFGGK